MRVDSGETATAAICRVLAERPGLTARELGEAVGATAMKICAELAVRGKLRRARALSGRLPRVWCYYNVSDSDYGNNGLGGRARDGD